MSNMGNCLGVGGNLLGNRKTFVKSRAHEPNSLSIGLKLLKHSEQAAPFYRLLHSLMGRGRRAG